MPKDRTSGGQKHGEKDLTASTKLWGPDPSVLSSESRRTIVQSFCLGQGSVLLGSRGHILDFCAPKKYLGVTSLLL